MSLAIGQRKKRRMEFAMFRQRSFLSAQQARDRNEYDLTKEGLSGATGVLQKSNILTQRNGAVDQEGIVVLSMYRRRRLPGSRHLRIDPLREVNSFRAATIRM